jgi:hypothetical protein
MSIHRKMAEMSGQALDAVLSLCISSLKRRTSYSLPDAASTELHAEGATPGGHLASHARLGACM